MCLIKFFTWIIQKQSTRHYDCTSNIMGFLDIFWLLKVAKITVYWIRQFLKCLFGIMTLKNNYCQATFFIKFFSIGWAVGEYFLAIIFVMCVWSEIVNDQRLQISAILEMVLMHPLQLKCQMWTYFSRVEVHVSFSNVCFQILWFLNKRILPWVSSIEKILWITKRPYFIWFFV